MIMRVHLKCGREKTIYLIKKIVLKTGQTNSARMQFVKYCPLK